MEVAPTQLTSGEIYKLVTGSIVPRPIAFVSTISSEGVPNLAPFSFFNAVSGDPPIIMFAISYRNGQKKDTLINIENHPQFVLNIVTEDLLQPMHNASADYFPHISEFDEVKLTIVPAKKIKGIAVNESPIHLECELENIVPIGRNQVVFGRIVYFNIKDELVSADYKIDQQKLKAVGRIGGPQYAYLREIVKLDKTFDENKVIKNVKLMSE